MFKPNSPKKNLTDFSKMDREVSSGIIVFRMVSGEPYFLILYYGQGQWTFPRGKIEKEEKSFQAALRETREETGLVRNDLKFFDYFKAYENWVYEKNHKKIHKTIIFYLAQTEKKNIKTEERSQGYGWFTYREALKIFVGPKNSENRKVLKKAYDFLTKKRRSYHQKPTLTDNVSN
jgi:8-oxo-dGTP pyrophosphatase MutT (NUDIX family)